MPWIQLTEDTLWWSGGNQLFGFRRSESFHENNRIIVRDNIRSDICKFIARNECIITGHRYLGYIFLTSLYHLDYTECINILQRWKYKILDKIKM